VLSEAAIHQPLKRDGSGMPRDSVTAAFFGDGTCKQRSEFFELPEHGRRSGNCPFSSWFENNSGRRQCAHERRHQ